MKHYDHITRHTTLYAAYKGKERFQMKKEELKVYLAILILSGYNSLPSRRLYWQKEEDVRVSAVANAMRRDRFEEIMRFLHFNSNDRLDANDRYWKIRPLVSMLQNNFLKHFVPQQNLSHDEAMIRYFGR